MKSLFKISLALLFVSAIGCKKYQTQFEGPYDDATGSKPAKVTYEIAFSVDGQLQIADKTLTNTKLFSGITGVKKLSINDSHDQIAYKTATGNITIIDSTGVQISVVPNSGSVEWFDFHANNRTLYMLQNHKLTQFGPTISIVKTNLESALPGFGSEYEIPTAAVAADGSVAFGYSYYQGFGYDFGVWIVNADGSTLKVQTNYQLPYRLRLSNSTNQFIMTTSQSGTSDSHYLGQLNSTYAEQHGSSGTAIQSIAPNGSDEVYWSPDGFGGNRLYLYVNSGRTLVLPSGAVVDDLDW